MKNQLILEKEKEDKTKDEEVQIVQATAEKNTKAIVHAMSQVILRDIEIIGLKTQNYNLAKAIKKK